MDPSEAKRLVRERIWRLLEERGVALPPRPVRGRIPNFQGAREAARLLAGLPEWRRARVVKVNPDSPQRWVRLTGLVEGKLVVMATPRLRSGFLLLDPARIPGSLYSRASTIRGAFQLGRLIGIEELSRIGGVDLIVTGSVAVDRRGHRVGKGEGYAEIEYGVLRELGLIGPETPVATTIHELQLVEYIPREPYDLSLDIVVTPRRVIRVEPGERPPGIIWSLLPCSKYREMPILQELARVKGVVKRCS